MKFRLLNFAALIGAMIVPAHAAAEPGAWYVAADVGLHRPSEMILDEVMMDSNVDIGLEQNWSVFARVGRSIGENWRVELELAHRPGDFAFRYTVPVPDGFDTMPFDGEVNAQTLMGNVIYDFAADRSVRPFVGVGVGEARFEVEENARYRSEAFAWQALAGVSWRLSERARFDLIYRLLESEVEAAGFLGNDMDYQNQSLSVGLRYAF